MTVRSCRVLLVLVATLVLMPLMGCEDKINQENFDQIKVGMNLYEVEALLGGKGEMVERGGSDISATGIGGHTQATQQLYEWHKGSKTISVVCVDGKVVQPGKSGF